MELRHLRSFTALVEHRHFGRAAESLHLAQPALSQQIKQLERELGTTLFTRTTRRVEVTEAGERLLRHARTVLADVDDTLADMARFAAGRAGRVSVGFVGTATYDVLPGVARRVRETLPDVELELRGEVLSPALAAGLRDRTYDLAVVRPGVDEPLTLLPLRTERLVAVLPREHRLAHHRRLDLAQLADEPFVTHPSGHRSSFQRTVLEACAAAGFTPDPVLEVAETATLVVFVAAGLGVALVPEPVRSLGHEGVVYVPLHRAPTAELALAHRPGDLSPAAGAVAAVLQSVVSAKTP
ncbi:LysR family transcriptional regulator [Nocardioides zeae]|uniref:LysR family transcriptional regulator n=1 Tax=Nocardioides zeae TaxID=1457234 RepID=A0A6P0HNQ6_9ACTN|nr:LysR family transcriptional regulator [Nocardioides zeae]NEN79874.1 LysR family transcriptional regulator [Nocardioides zeae]